MATFSSSRGGFVRVHPLFHDSWMASHGPLVPASLCGAWFPYHSNPIRPSSSLFPRIHGIHPRPQQQQQQHEDDDDSDDESVSRRRAAGRGAHARGLPRGRGDVTRGLQSEGTRLVWPSQTNRARERCRSWIGHKHTPCIHACGVECKKHAPNGGLVEMDGTKRWHGLETKSKTDQQTESGNRRSHLSRVELLVLDWPYPRNSVRCDGWIDTTSISESKGEKGTNQGFAWLMGQWKQICTMGDSASASTD